MNATEQAQPRTTLARFVACLLAGLAEAARSYAMAGPFCPLFRDTRKAQ
jgi:hypothetical protein